MYQRARVRAHRSSRLTACTEAPGWHHLQPLIPGQWRQLAQQLGGVGQALCLSLLDDAIGHSVSECRTPHDPLHLPEHIVVEVRGGATGLPAQEGMFGNHVTPASPLQGAYVDPGHAIPMAGNTEQCRGGAAGGRQRVGAGVGLQACVGGRAEEVDIELGGAEKIGGIED